MNAERRPGQRAASEAAGGPETTVRHPADRRPLRLGPPCGCPVRGRHEEPCSLAVQELPAVVNLRCDWVREANLYDPSGLAIRVLPCDGRTCTTKSVEWLVWAGTTYGCPCALREAS